MKGNVDVDTDSEAEAKGLYLKKWYYNLYFCLYVTFLNYLCYNEGIYETINFHLFSLVYLKKKT